MHASTMRFPTNNPREPAHNRIHTRDSRTRLSTANHPAPDNTPGTGDQGCGGHSAGETPGPIPNPEAKTRSADGTAPGRVWESRTPPHHTTRNGPRQRRQGPHRFNPPPPPRGPHVSPRPCRCTLAKQPALRQDLAQSADPFRPPSAPTLSAG